MVLTSHEINEISMMTGHDTTWSEEWSEEWTDDEGDVIHERFKACYKIIKYKRVWRELIGFDDESLYVLVENLYILTRIYGE